MCRKKMAIIPLLFIGVQIVLGQNESDTTLTAPTMKAVTVSAVRFKVEKKNVPQQITVISAKEIEQTGANDVTDVLKKNAGVDVIQYPGILSGIGIRGYRPQFSGINQRTLILIDGHPAGVTNIGMIDLNNVAQIEVLKGAASALYGSQAMGGVVNIITKKNDGAIKKSIYGSFGSYNALEIGVDAGGSIDEKLSFDINLKYFQKNENYRMGNDNLFRKMFKWEEAELTYYNPLNTIDSVKTINDTRGDGETREFTKYRYQSGRVRFGYKIHKNWSANVSGTFFSANNVQEPGDIFYGNTGQSIKNPYRYGLDFGVEGKIREKHQVTVKAYTSLENSDYRSASKGVVADFVTSIYTHKWLGFQVQDKIKIKNHAVVVGMDQQNVSTASKSFKYDTGEEKAPYSPNYGIYSSAVFAQTYLSFLEDNLHVNAGVRFDNIAFDVKETPFLDTYSAGKETFGVINPSAGVKYKFLKDFNLHGSVGEAFVTPDAYKVAGYSVAGPGAPEDVKGKVNVTYGNPKLRPEKGLTLDGGIGYQNSISGLEVDFTLFSTSVKDKITTGATTVLSTIELTDDGDTIVSKTSYVNAEKAKMNGVEILASWDAGAFSSYNYSFKLFINAVKYFTLESELKNMAEGYSKEKIKNVADLTVNYGVEYAKGKLRGRIASRYVGIRYDNDWSDYIKHPEIAYNPFMVVDLALGFKVNTHGELGVQINNVTDENYYEKRGFNLQGRNLNIKYTHNF